jgi:predicted DNA-binding helix-hairpin-helix protein
MRFDAANECSYDASMTADVLERLDVLGGDAQFDLCAAGGRPAPDGDGSAAGLARAERRYRHGDVRRHISLVRHPKGPMPVLKLLQTNACAKDCFYCPFRAGRSFRREAFTPDELARLTDQLARAGMVRGLFLSSGVIGHGDQSMERIVDTAEILRAKYRFRGYLHLKIMPRASNAAIERAVRLADRVSINLEAPNAERLGKLSRTKDFAQDLVSPLERAAAIAAAAPRPVSQTTQLVVGAAGESDAEILATTQRLYRDLRLARVYYSAFRPIPDTPLDGRPAEDPSRERRLYQADFLLRDYGFAADELPLGGDGRLDPGVDPKLAWARAHPEWFPVELNRADREALLRVPGLGAKAVAAVLAARRLGRLRDGADLRRLGIQADRVLPWVTLDGRRAPLQLPLPLRPERPERPVRP